MCSCGNQSIRISDLKMMKYNRVEFIKLAGLACASLALNPGLTRGAVPPVPVRTGIFPFYKYARKYDAWEFTPMDQGGRLVQLEVVGSETDIEIVKAIRNPDFFQAWGSPIQWDALEKTQVEKSVWLNRWYFLNSFAYRYYKTGDKQYLQEILTFIRQWRDENPLPSDLAAYFKARHYNWRDMQVAWRMQNLCWCYFLGKDGFSKEEKLELYELVKTHASCLLAFFGDHPLIENNHQSHGATAMLYASLLFPELPEAVALKDRAIEILNHHLEHAFYADGNSIELCPGYYPFFVSIFRDAWLLCKANGVQPPKRCFERLQQFYHYLNVVRQPDGTMPPINDSTESDSQAAIAILEDIIKPQARGSAASHHFSSSHQAVMRGTGSAVPSYAFLDAGQAMLAHWHTGKLGFHLWFWNKAFLLDSGICNYDDPLRRSWYWKPEAHNTLLVDGNGDYNKDRRDAISKLAATSIKQWQSTSQYDWVVMQHEGFNNLKWIRHFVNLKGLTAIVIDEIESTEEHQYTWLFHLLPCIPKIDEKTKSVFTDFDEKNLLIQPSVYENLRSVTMDRSWINRKGKNVEAPLLKYQAFGKSLVQAFLLLPVEGSSRSEEVQLQQNKSEGTIHIAFRCKSASADIDLTRSPADKNLYQLKVSV